MDAWGVDVMVAACQKGLMTPPGMAFTFHGPKAEATGVRCTSPYWDWGPRTAPSVTDERFSRHRADPPPLRPRTALDMILDEEGLEAVWTRHAVFARTIWAAVEAWGEAGALALNIADPGQRSHAVTTIRTAPATARGCAAGAPTPPESPSASASACRASIPTACFRIGHMGHLNPPMLLGTLAHPRGGLCGLGVAHRPAGAEAAERGGRRGRRTATRPRSAGTRREIV